MKKLITFLIWVAILFPMYSQQNLLNRPISIKIENQSVVEALRQLIKEVPCTINFIPSEVPKRRSINKSYQEEPLSKVIKDIWGNEQLALRVRSNTISIQANPIKPQALKKVKLHGRITDARKKYLPGVTVRLSGTLLGAVTDGEGEYEIINIPVGKYAVSVSSVGFETQKKTVTIIKDKNLNFILKEAINQLEEVVVVGETAKSKLEASAQAIKVVELKTAKLKTADLGEVLARTEGVAIQRAGGLGSGTRISLNGLTDDQIRVFVNGVPVQSAGYTQDIANVPVGLIDHVEVYKGVVPIRFGADALGGAINLVSPEVPNGLDGSGSYQFGSFGTHRVASNISYGSEKSGFYVEGAGFYDFARNDFEIDVQIPDERGRLSDFTVPRFHDSYEAYGTNVTVGIRNRLWADELSIKGFYVDGSRDLQNNAVQTGLPFGEIKTFLQSKGIIFNYEVAIQDRLNIQTVAGISENTLSTVDTSRCRYNWFGECFTEVRTRGELFSNGTDQSLFDEDAFARFTIEYQWKPRHLIVFTTAPTHNRRKGRNKLFEAESDPLQGESDVLTWISGLEYQWKDQADKFENRIFIKDYRQSTDLVTLLFGNQFSTRSGKINDVGVGNVLRVKWSERLTSKISYERSIRLPNRNELLGDGIFITPNIELEPEKSHNGNVEIDYSSAKISTLPWNIQTNFFIRATENLITLIQLDETFNSFQNVFNATSVGIELDGNASLLSEKLKLEANATYQSFRNTTDEGLSSRFKGDRIPNRPYFFSNANASYQIDSPLRKNQSINLFVNTRYAHSFFRSWESAGIREFAIEIPSQNTYGLGATYEMVRQTSRWALTAEVQNLTNAKVFDFLGVQRPGRAFYMKISTQF